jgi:BioD-like phosphotransacetylase family protein
MSTTEIVTILNIDQNIEKKKKDGGPYKATILLVKPISGGQAGERLILQSIVDKAADMQTALNTLQTGDVATLVHQAREGSTFTNIVGVYVGNVPDAQSQQAAWNGAGGGGAGKSYQKDTTGIQVGNALNNAAILLANKVMKGTLETVAEHVLIIAEKLKAKLKAGTYKHVEGAPAQATASRTSVAETFVEDDDVPFN